MMKQNKSAARSPNLHLSAADLKKIRGGLSIGVAPVRPASEKADEDFPIAPPTTGA